MFRWFGVWLDWIVAVYLALVVYSFLVLGGGENISPSFTKIFLISYCYCHTPTPTSRSPIHPIIPFTFLLFRGPRMKQRDVHLTRTW